MLTFACLLLLVCGVGFLMIHEVPANPAPVEKTLDAAQFLKENEEKPVEAKPADAPAG